MKQIINGKTYNTETAECIGSYRSGCGPRDFRYVREELYRTKKGAYFTAGEGGPMTSYAVSCGDNSWCGGEEIRPISEEEAKEWMEEHCDTEDYINAFGEPEEA